MKAVTFGRGRSNDVVIDDQYVSRTAHCQICQHDDGSYSLIDGSTNGTYVNGNRAPRGKEIPLDENDIVRIGIITLPWLKYFETELPPSPPLPGDSGDGGRSGQKMSNTSGIDAIMAELDKMQLEIQAAKKRAVVAIVLSIISIVITALCMSMLF